MTCGDVKDGEWAMLVCRSDGYCKQSCGNCLYECKFREKGLSETAQLRDRLTWEAC